MGEQYGGRRDENVQLLFEYLQSSLKKDDKIKLYFRGQQKLCCEVVLKNHRGTWQLFAKINKS